MMNADEHDKIAARYFNSGWDAAIREAFLWYDQGAQAMERFRDEQRQVFK